MSFETLKKEKLLEIAEEFGVDVKATDTKALIIAAFAEDGVNWEDTIKFDKDVAEADVQLKAEAVVAKSEEEQVLIRMTRKNPTYEIRGYVFKNVHPFALVAESDAEWITENDEGFRYASPKEATEFYG